MNQTTKHNEIPLADWMERKVKEDLYRKLEQLLEQHEDQKTSHAIFSFEEIVNGLDLQQDETSFFPSFSKEADYVTYDQAQQLKKVGFPQEKDCYTTLYPVKGEYKGLLCRYNPALPERDKDSINAPTLAKVCQWLRDYKFIDIDILTDSQTIFERIIRSYTGSLINANIRVPPFGVRREILTTGPNGAVKTFPTYEEALSACIDKAIDFLQKN